MSIVSTYIVLGTDVPLGCPGANVPAISSAFPQQGKLHVQNLKVTRTQEGCSRVFDKRPLTEGR